MSDCVLILTTVADTAAGARIARTLVEERLAACVNVHGPMTSSYRWKGTVAVDEERQLVIKTTSARVPAVRARLSALHTYELPEFLVVPVAEGSDAYLAWVRAESTPQA
jgi:periplasmic divalent cation tolerance protein